MEATENVQATDNGIENAETSEEVKVQKSDESLSENNKPGEAEKEQNEDKAELFRQAVLKSKRERAARAERILGLVAQFCGADKCDYDGIENAVPRGTSSGAEETIWSTGWSGGKRKARR